MSAVVKSDMLDSDLVYLGSVSASKVLPGPKVNGNRKLVKARLLNQAALAADATNYVVVKLMKDGVSIAEIDTRSGAEGALTANAAKDFPEGDLDLAADVQLTVDVTVGGTGALTLAQLQLDWHRK